MKNMEKQLIKEMVKNKIFLICMFLMSAMTTFMYFFVHFSIDANWKILKDQTALSEGYLAYKQALISNRSLARSMLMGFCLLTAFVYALFYYRFFKSQKRSLGCLKQLGFTDQSVCSVFMKGTSIIHLAGSLIGLAAGERASDILLRANMRTYVGIEALKGISFETICIGVGVPGLVVILITYLSYGIIRGKETSRLISGIDQQATYGVILKIAHKLSCLFPKRYRLSVRLALRNVVATTLILLSVMMVSIMFMLAYSLNRSSAKLFEAQTIGRSYRYDTTFNEPLQQADGQQGTMHDQEAIHDQKFMHYIEEPCSLELNDQSVKQAAIGMEENPSLFELLSETGQTIDLPVAGEVVIPKQLEEVYGLRKGDEITAKVNGQLITLKVSHIAYNAKINCLYMNKSELAKVFGLEETAYTGLLSVEKISEEGKTITQNERIEMLKRQTVSNKVSAVINEVIGCIMGCLLLFLALLLNFQSNTREILILKGIGYEKKAIREMLIDIYRPIIIVSFLVTLYPSIQIVRMILRSLSMQIEDYLMFQTNGYVILGIFILINIGYSLVQYGFNVGIKRITKKESVDWQLQ